MKSNEAPEKYIPKSDLVAEIEKWLEETDKGFPNDHNLGRYDMCKQILSFLDTIEVKEVDLEHLEQEVKDFCYKFDDRKDKWYDMTPHDKNIMISPTWSNFAMQLAKHFFVLGLKAQKEK